MTLARKHVLVVEDEYFIANDLKRALQAADAIVVGPTADLSTALSLAASTPLDVAILDVNLEGATSYAIADQLADRAVPYMFLTGYDGWALPDGYKSAPRLSKPFQMPDVIACVDDLTRRGEGS